MSKKKKQILHWIHPATHTCGPDTLGSRPGSRWWRRWSSCLSPPPGGPGPRLWRRLCSDQCGKGWSPTPELWSTVTNDRSSQRGVTWRLTSSGSGVNSSYHELAGLLAVHEALWDGAGSENFVPKRRTRRKESLNWLDSRLWILSFILFIDTFFKKMR